MDIILFPETFVHGYFDNATDAKKASIDLSSQSFTDVLKVLSNIDATIIIGVCISAPSDHRIRKYSITESGLIRSPITVLFDH